MTDTKDGRLPDGTVYPCFTIADMARIPPEARERMFAELPKLVETIEGALAAGIFSGSRETDFAAFGPCKWADDDLGEERGSITIPGGEEIARWTCKLGDGLFAQEGGSK